MEKTGIRPKSLWEKIWGG